MRLIRQLLTEATLLSSTGAAFGLVASYWGLKALLSFSPTDLPELMAIRMDSTILLFTLGIALATGLLAMLPALAALAL